MIGAIIGDIIGSVYEHRRVTSFDFKLFSPRCCFTDDSVLTIAVANAILACFKKNTGKSSRDYYLNYIRLYGKRYPDAGYGHSFYNWLCSHNPRPYNSYGNGSAMRVSPVGLAFNTISDVLDEAKKTASISHNHPDGIKGAQAVAAAVFLAHNGSSKSKIKDFIEKKIGYPLGFNLEDLRKYYNFEIQCSKSVPQAIFTFLESHDFEDAIRKAIYIGGDSDTLACISGAIAGAFYKQIPQAIKNKALNYLDAEQKKVIFEFNKKFHINY